MAWNRYVSAGAAGMSRPVFEPVEGEPADLADRLHGLYWLVSDLSESQPLALLIDDAHWADEQSLRWINHLAARIRDVPVLLIVATRPGEKSTSALLSPSHDALAVTRLQLGPLSDESVAAMVETGLGQEPTPAFLAACMQATGGNPYLVNELTRALAAAGVTPDDRESGRLAEFSPDSIRSTLARRIADEGEQAVA